MRRLVGVGICVALGTIAAVPAAANESADDLVAKGEALGRAGKFREALAAFHEAETTAPRPVHDCYIAVAHLRLGEATASRYFLDRCQERAGDVDPIEWYPAARAEVAAQTSAFGELEVSSSLTELTVAIEPSIGITVKAPATLWLAPGRYRVAGTAASGAVEPVNADIEPGRVARVRLVARAAIAPEEVVTSEEPALSAQPARRSPTLGYLAIGLGGLGLVGGGLAHRQALGAVDRAKEPQSPAEYDDEVAAIERNRAIAYGLYATSAALAAVGIYLIWRAHRANRDRPILNVSSDGQGASLSLGGSF